MNKASNRDLNAVGKFLADFSQEDPGSDAFMYPVDRNNNPLVPNLRTINVRHLEEIMERMAAFLDAATSAISAHLDLKREMEQYNNPFGQLVGLHLSISIDI